MTSDHIDKFTENVQPPRSGNLRNIQEPEEQKDETPSDVIYMTSRLEIGESNVHDKQRKVQGLLGQSEEKAFQLKKQDFKDKYIQNKGNKNGKENQQKTELH